MKYCIQTGVNNPILRTISEKVTDIDDELVQFCLLLRRAMWENDGVGLAAPQIGRNVRIISTTQWKKGGERKRDNLLGEIIMINPVITERSTEMVIGEEACLSIPDIFGMVKRHKNITVEYTDSKGHRQIKKLKDFNARIIQHEMDHLDGILFVDKVIAKKKGK